CRAVRLLRRLRRRGSPRQDPLTRRSVSASTRAGSPSASAAPLGTGRAAREKGDVMSREINLDLARTQMSGGTADLLSGPATKIAAKVEQLGGTAALGEPVSKQWGLWTFPSSCVAYDQGSDSAFEIHGAIYEK